MKRFIAMLLLTFVVATGMYVLGRVDDGRFALCAAVPFEADKPANASTAYQALVRCESPIPGHSCARYEPSFMYLTAWPMGQVLEATVSMATAHPNSPELRADLDRVVDSLHYYWDDSTTPGGYTSTVQTVYGHGTKYYDDNTWIGMALLEAYKVEPQNQWLLNRAEQIFKLEQQGASNTLNLPNPGGVFWEQGQGYRATVSTAGASELALMLYQVTHYKVYLRFAEQQFAWVNDTLLGNNGLYFDGINADGSKNEMQWSYNQGLMIGDGVLLYLSTGDQSYLAKAKDIADAAVRHFSDSVLWEQDPFFDAVFFKNLMLLDTVAHDSRYGQMMDRYADAVRKNMDPQNGLFVWHGHIASLDQSAAVEVLVMDS